MNYVIQCISCKQVSDIFIMPKLNLDSEQNRKFEKILKLKVEPVSSLFDSRLKVSKNGLCVGSTSTNKISGIFWNILFLMGLL